MTPVRIVARGSGRDAYLPLLRLADDSEAEVLGYYQTGDLCVLDDDSTALGVVLVVAEAGAAVELKAVAVDEMRQGRGVGRRLIAAVLADLQERGVRRVVVGTANAGIGQLAFYQKCGFRLDRIERDFFSAARGYPPDLQENGIPIRDMVWMDQAL